MMLAHGKDGNVFHDHHIIKRIFKDRVVDHMLLWKALHASYLQCLCVALTAIQHGLGGTHRRFRQTFSVGVLSNALYVNQLFLSTHLQNRPICVGHDFQLLLIISVVDSHRRSESFCEGTKGISHLPISLRSSSEHSVTNSEEEFLTLILHDNS